METDQKRTTINILGIETSCDETAAAVVADGTNVRSSVVASQARLHEKYGGVVPEIASRAHIENIYPVIAEALGQAKVTEDDIDAVAVAPPPGLRGTAPPPSNSPPWRWWYQAAIQAFTITAHRLSRSCSAALLTTPPV